MPGPNAAEAQSQLARYSHRRPTVQEGAAHMDPVAWFSKNGTTPLLALGVGTAALVVLLSLYYGFRIRRLQRELSGLRVRVGEFTESDIAIVLRHAVTLEVQGDRERALALFRLVAEKSTDSGTVKLANSGIERLANQAL